MTGCRSGRPVVGTSDDRATVPVIPVAPDSDMLSAAIADTENEVCPADSGDPESSERRRLYRRSAEPADSVWINRLNGVIPAGQDRAIRVYVKYNRLVCGYEVTACWMPFDAYSETGQWVMNFRSVSGGRNFQYADTGKYSNPMLMDITFAKNFQGHRNGDVYYFDYVSATDSINREYYPNSPLGYYTPFQFFDADFDGKDELLVNDFGMDRQGNSYTVFDITAKGLHRKDYLPFAEIDNETEFYPAVGTIVLYAHDGVHDSSWSTFRKRQNRERRKTLLVPDRLADATSGRLLQKYNEQGEPDFELAAIQQTFAIWEQDGRQNGDSIYVYEVTDERLELIRMQRSDTSRNVEIYNPISFSFEYEPNVQGYRVEGRLFAFDTPQGLGNRLEGPCRLSFYNESTGCRYDIFCEHYCDESSIPGWYDETGEYVFNPGVGKTEGTLCFDYSTLQGEDDRGPFVFEDVDFDGKDEILIRRTSPLRNSVHYYEVYKPVGADSCVLLNYPPFNGFYCDHCGWDEISPEKNSITRYHSDHKMQVFWFHRRIGISGFNYPYAVDTVRAEFFYL